MKVNTGITILLLVLVLAVASCAVPASKEAYLNNFERFVKDVEINGGKFRRSDWKWANKHFSRYTGEYYNKFRDELKMEEKIRVSVLKGRYLAAKGSSVIGRLVQDDLKKELGRLGEDIRKYVDENLDNDLEEIKRGAREIGDSAVKVIEDVLNEIKKKKE